MRGQVNRVPLHLFDLLLSRVGNFVTLLVVGVQIWDRYRELKNIPPAVG